MNVVDSSAWLEYFSGGIGAKHFASAIEAVHQLVVPSITLYEVYKRVREQRSEGEALVAVAAMEQGQVVDLTATIALQSARLGVLHKLPLADSVVLGTAQAVGATLWTQDADFDGIANVRFFPKKPALR